ncbi:S1C family serine protease [Paenibacillus prosopidis]|uniref:Trypsin-like peptidase n=1 Tax=Paenibacillus prosopidis TaxID=630520 RepID=A0A368W5P5_9BACL|nr:trypsin-like peptidase domain-containing protein [Paenibacillus prosopidis]RCW48317.1 trypsin-like peptidase [Paenibacillus prosopidis]
MNEENKRTSADNGSYDTTTNTTASANPTPVTTYTYESRMNTSDLRASYEKELGMHMDMLKPSMGGSKLSKRNSRNSARTMLASFLIGAVVIGGFSYMADKNNLFSGSGQPVQSTGSVVSNDANDNAGLSTASLSTSDGIAAIYEEASPAVVKIETYAEPVRSNSMMDDPAFRQFFGGGGQQEEQQQTDEQSSGNLELMGSGTGFFFENDGYILTNEHVIADAEELQVSVQGYDEPLTAQVLGSSYELDLAVLKVESPDGKEFHSLTLGSSDGTQIGDWVIAIGNPYGFDQTLTMGVLSAKERPITIADEQGNHEYEHLLQTDASINPGNSGGPLLNESGEVIGINTAVNSEAQGIGFAIPTSTITEVLDQLKANSL